MIHKKIIEIVSNKLGEGFIVYKDSFHEHNETIFFLCRDNKKKFYGEISNKKDFTLSESLKSNIGFGLDGRNKYIGLFKTSKENSKKIINIFSYLKPVKINKKSSFGFGDRIGITSGIHAKFANSYDIFPVFAQQSVREITKSGKEIEDILHDAVIGVFQSGFKGGWGADADHVRDKEWLKLMLGNSFLPYSMFTVDTIDYFDFTDTKTKDLKEDKEFTVRIEKAKKYIGKKIKFLGWEFIFDEESLFKIVKMYYKSLSHLKSCYDLIKEKIDEFDFEPTFDETDIINTPEEHFYLANELMDDGVEYSTLALRLPGNFEKSVDFAGDERELESSIRLHNEIAGYFGNYKLSLHSADYKFKVFKLFRNILGDNFHMKLGGSTWREAIRTVAELDKDLFRKILDISLDRAVENSVAYHMQIDADKISRIIKTNSLSDLFSIKEVIQLLEISYGTILNSYRDTVENLLINKEEEYEHNIFDNYKSHFDKIFF